MEPKSLENLFAKHFDFLTKEYGFKYDASSHRYFKKDYEIIAQHENGELNLIFIINQKTTMFIEIMSRLLGREFTYPEHFTSWVLSMGDVDSRLAYDAKLIKANAQEILGAK